MNPHLLALPPCVALCALGYRIRGGLWNDRIRLPGQMARLLGWGLPCAVTALAAGAEWWLAGLIAAAMWASSTIGLFGFMDLGHNEGTPAGDFALGTLRGWLGVLPAVVILGLAGYPHWWWLEHAGATMGALYALAWRWPIPVRGFGLGGGPPRYDPPETGELYYGAVVGLALFCSIFSSQP